MNIKYYINFRHYGLSDNKEYFNGDIETKKVGNIYELSADITCVGVPYDYARVFSSDPSLCVDICLNGKVDGALSRVQFNPFWSKPSFEKDFSRLSDNIQNILIKQGDEYTAVLPLCLNDFNAYICGSQDRNTLRINISKHYDGAKRIKGTFCIIACCKNPYDAVKKAYAYAVDNGYIVSPMRSEKKLPEMYKKLGWCSWNAFYHEVSERGIIDKMEEFKDKGIPVRWIMIDDGWSETSVGDSSELISFYEDQKKFPNGLKKCIERLKNDYGIEKVGVWHSLTGYWNGISSESELNTNGNYDILRTNADLSVPASHTFFDEWYSYLKAQGVDFVKIDTQGNTLEYLRGMRDCVSLCIDIQKAAEMSAQKYFGGNVINCMGMGNLNSHYRPYTAVSRSSDDFYPDNDDSLKSHIVQNVYNSVFLGNLFYSDFDMWWSNHKNAKTSAALRMISGGPVYISDGIGDTNPENIMPLINNNGELKLCDDTALPTEDCLFGHDGVVKVFNRRNGKKYIAAFNLTDKSKNIDLFDGGKLVKSFILDGNHAELTETEDWFKL